MARVKVTQSREKYCSRAGSRTAKGKTGHPKLVHCTTRSKSAYRKKSTAMVPYKKR